jgi:deoxyinosine 3'endonuclease (endonuclease V)
MKFKSEEEVIEEIKDQKTEKEECPMGQAIDIAYKQLDLISSMVISLRSSLENIKIMYEEHNPS